MLATNTGIESENKGTISHSMYMTVHIFSLDLLLKEKVKHKFQQISYSNVPSGDALES
jgi:hypothetical protein